MYTKTLRNNLNKIIWAGVFAVLGFITPLYTHAADEFKVAGWIPYWQKTLGASDAREHLDAITEINPFSHVVTTDGSLKDLAGLRKSPWTKLFRSARSDDVEIIPTIMWSDADAMHTVLSNPELRADHIDEIVAMVKKGKYDGVDIDYEGRKAETKDYFSAFVKELKGKLGSKTLSCTIEPRTPADSLYTVIPIPLKLSNDYAVIGQYCDEVKIMAYDQQRADIKLNASKKGLPYAPVADVDWVRKVVALAVQTIPKEKILLGIPTYGRIWEVGVEPQQYKTYSQVKATNHVPAAELADDLKITPSRNSAGELSFTYIPETTTDPISNVVRSISTLLVKGGASQADAVGAAALAVSNGSNLPARFNIVWWSDAEAVRQKVALAKEFGLSGVALFKIDGDEDPAIWDIFE